MMESRPRVSKRTLLIGFVAVGFVTVVILMAEGFIAFHTKTARTGLLMVGTTASDKNRQKSERGDETSSETSSSKNGSKSGDQNGDAKNTRTDNKDSTEKKENEKETSDVETTFSGTESCRSVADNGVVSALDCRLCTSHDQKHIDECAETGRVEQTVTCLGGKPTNRKHRSCQRRGSKEVEEEQHNFLVFEAVNVGLGIAAYLVVLLRRKRLDAALAKKIEQQLATGV